MCAVVLCLYASVRCCHKCLYAIFFFKQKTAYEMRISDWSSDVCSSDLGGGGEAALAGESVAAFDQRVGGADRLQLVQQCGQVEIGRASCRERVCQYV